MLNLGGGGLPYPGEVLQLWGGEMRNAALPTPRSPVVVSDDGSGAREYAIVAVGPQGKESARSPSVKARGRARLHWDSVLGGDAYIVYRDGKKDAGPLPIEGSQKDWRDELK